MRNRSLASTTAPGLNELKVVLKMSAHVGQSGTVNRTYVEPTTQDDFQKLKSRKRHISNNTSHLVRKSANPDSTSTVVKLPLKASLTRNLYTRHRTANVGTGNTAAENTIGRTGPQKPGGAPPIMMAYMIIHVRLPNGDYEFRNARNGTCTITK